MKGTKQSNPRRKNTPGKLRPIIAFILIPGVILVLLDQLLKKYFIEHSYYFSLFSLHFVKNTGMSFGLMQDKVIIMIIVSFLFLGILWWFRNEFKDCKYCLMLLAAGTIGNLIDRIFRGYVVDFFDLGWFPVFNLADAMITLGTAGIIFIFLKDLKKEINEKKNKERIKEKKKH